mmetsp:Transcript_3178/g.9415  ORF Transcript_3178/g.9415 Transcript_3178/m.9415 type:complete len:237 (+) Transcript_3178:853-1563(+)
MNGLCVCGRRAELRELVECLYRGEPMLAVLRLVPKVYRDTACVVGCFVVGYFVIHPGRDVQDVSSVEQHLLRWRVPVEMDTAWAFQRITRTSTGPEAGPPHGFSCNWLCCKFSVFIFPLRLRVGLDSHPPRIGHGQEPNTLAATDDDVDVLVGIAVPAGLGRPGTLPKVDGIDVGGPKGDVRPTNSPNVRGKGGKLCNEAIVLLLEIHDGGILPIRTVLPPEHVDEVRVRHRGLGG